MQTIIPLCNAHHLQLGLVRSCPSPPLPTAFEGSNLQGRCLMIGNIPV